MSQFNSCGYNDYLVALDGMLSKKPQLVGAIGNLVAQYFTGKADKNTSFWISKDNLTTAWNNKDWEGIGENTQLFMSQLLKVEAADVTQAITFIN